MKTKSKQFTYLLQAYLFLVPAAIVLIMFLYYPVVQGINYSFYHFKNFLPDKFVGFNNYKTAWHDPIFWNSIYLTLKWVVMNAFIPTAIGLVLAILLEYFTKVKWLAHTSRTILFMPMMMSMVAVGLLWTLIYDPNLGMLNGLLHAFGYKGIFNAYSNLKTALYMTYIPVVWQSSGFSMVVFSAALQSVSKDIVESSMVEGANKINQIRYIMIPSILKTITMIIIVNMISGFKAFDLLYVLTRGGPGMSTEITAVYAYKQAFFAFKFEYASTMTVCLLVCVIFFLAAFNFASQRIENKFGS